MPIDVGRQLSATWLISGGYQRMGDLIRITARGVEVDTGTVIRSVKIDGAFGEIFALQDKIVYELTQGMNLTLHDSEVAEIERNETESVKAYEARSRAMMKLLEGSPQALDEAIDLLERATEKDPNYASAWAALGAAYDLKGSFLSLSDISAKAIDVERRAIAIDPKLADAHRWLGLSLLSQGRYDEAIEAIQEAARLEPGTPTSTWPSAGPTGSGRGNWMMASPVWSARSPSIRTSAMPISSSACCTPCAATTTRLRHRADGRSRCRSVLSQDARASRSWERTPRLGYVHYLRKRYEDALEVFNRQAAALESSDHALKARSLIELHFKIRGNILAEWAEPMKPNASST